jgi:hypothetical protein
MSVTRGQMRAWLHEMACHSSHHTLAQATQDEIAALQLAVQDYIRAVVSAEGVTFIEGIKDETSREIVSQLYAAIEW